jgi:hypothetical protein
MPVAADFLLVHVGEQEVLRVGEAVGHARVDAREVVGERADVVVVVLRPAGEMRAAELAARPSHAERRLVGALALDRVFEGVRNASWFRSSAMEASFRSNQGFVICIQYTKI